MDIYFINLDRHPQRLQRMEKLLHGLSFKRIPAVDGKTLDGLEQRDFTRPFSHENLSRYDRACTMSHRTAWEVFLAGTEKYACVFEDDVYISPDFPRFVRDESWIPKNGNLIKIETSETTTHKILLSQQTEKCLDRVAAVLFSIHYGTAGYIVSRNGAADLLKRTEIIDRPIDHILFDQDAIRRHFPIYQLYPALCIQSAKLPGGIAFAELQSSIQPAPGSRRKRRKTVLQKIQIEIQRLFAQLGTVLDQYWLRARLNTVPFA